MAPSAPGASRTRTLLASRIGGLPRTFWLLWTGTLVNRLGTFVEPFLVLYLTAERGLSAAEAGLVLGLFGVGSIGGPVIGGTLADRVGRRATMVGALVVSAALLLGLGAARSIGAIATFSFLLGAAGDAYRPAAQAAMADVVAFGDRRRAAGLLYWAVNLGFSAAAVSGGLLASAGYSWLFVADAATCVGYAAVVGVFVGETRPAGPGATAGEAEAGSGGWGRLARDPLLLGLLGVMLVGAAAQTMLYAVLPLAMDSEGLGPEQFGLVLAVNGVVIVVLQPVLQGVILRPRPGTVLALSWGIFAIGLVVFAASSSLAGFFAGMLVMTLGEILSASIAPGLVQELAPPHLRGRYAGAFGLTYSVAFAVVPVGATQLLAGDGGAAAPWIVGAALAAGAVVAQLALGGALERRREAAAAADAVARGGDRGGGADSDPAPVAAGVPA